MAETVDASTGELVEFEPAGIAKYEGEGGLEAARLVAKQLDHFIRERGLAVKIQRGEHLRVEAWCALGTMMGVSPRTAWTKPVEIGDEHGFNARVEVVRISTGEVIGAAEALCMSGERMGKGARWKDLHAMQSMAQTRATSKALGQVLRWIPELAGYSGTPAEEMPVVPPYGERRDSYPPPPKPKESAVDVAKDVLGAQDANTSGTPFGETVKNGITERQVDRAIAIAIKRGEEFDTKGFHVLNSVLKESKYPTIPHGLKGDELKLWVSERISKKVYDDFIAAIEEWKPKTEREEF